MMGHGIVETFLLQSKIIPHGSAAWEMPTCKYPRAMVPEQQSHFKVSLGVSRDARRVLALSILEAITRGSFSKPDRLDEHGMYRNGQASHTFRGEVGITSCYLYPLLILEIWVGFYNMQLLHG
jgi:hypothetical protein